jgi:hypothetical protein
MAGQMDGRAADLDHIVACEAARAHLRQRRAPVPVRGKVPWDARRGGALDRWQMLRLAEPDLADYYQPGITGTGILLGEPSGGLIDVDLDCPEAIAAAPAYLPPTGCIFGRESAARSHYAYVCAPLPSTAKHHDVPAAPCEKSKTLVELRGTGGQTVWPPSLHVESGERVRYDLEGEPARVDGLVLQSAVRRVAACALLARHWPSAGLRHDCALALAGFLLRGGFNETETAKLAETAARIAGDEEWHDRVTAVQTTAAALGDGRPATGGPTLAAMLPDGVISKLTEWLELRQSADETAQGRRAQAGARGSQTTELLAVAEALALYHAPNGEPYADVRVDDHRETHPLRSRALRDWLAREYHHAHGRALRSEAVREVLGVLEGRARWDGEERPVAVRVAEYGGAIYLDVGDMTWRAIEVTADSWRIVAEPPVRFRRGGGMLPLPEPIRGGSIADLRALVRVRNAEWPLVVGWLLGALRPRGPYPLLCSK